MTALWSLDRSVGHTIKMLLKYTFLRPDLLSQEML